MSYDALLDRLSTWRPVSFAAFPDGSVDRYVTLRDGERRVSTRAAFVEAVAAGRDALSVEHVRDAPGGQAVNAARQAAALGDETTLVGHLDHPILSFPFETVSTGAPSTVTVVLFDEDDLLLVEESSDVRAWTFADLRAAVDDTAALFEVDAVCAVNWSSMPALTDAFDAVAEMDVDGGAFVLDPGTVSGAGDDRVRELLDSLERLGASHEVVLSVNEDERDRLAELLGVQDASEPAAHIRAEAGVDGVVVHGVDRATAATPSETLSVPNLPVDDPVTETGAGDRFSAALARARGADWEWGPTLALGNACASHYVASGESATRRSLADFVDGRRSG